MAACRALLADPHLSDDALMELLPSPDWGCGASVVGRDGLRDFITTGKRRVHRARYDGGRR